jgi:microcystin-dependent protein
MKNSTRLGIAYPEGPDTAVVPRDVKAVVDYLDGYAIVFSTGTIATRPASGVSKAGRLYYATDEQILYFDNGTAWLALNAPVSEVPVGALLDWTGGALPTNYMYPVGTAISRIDHAELYGKMGTKYGPGDGTTTFNIPDLRGRTAVMTDRGAGRLGAANDLGVSGGVATVLLTGPQSGTPTHAHTATAGEGFETSGGGDLGIGAPRIPAAFVAGSVGNVTAPGGFGVPVGWWPPDLNSIRLLPHKHYITVAAIAAANAAAAHENMPPWLAVDKILKVR